MDRLSNDPEIEALFTIIRDLACHFSAIQSILVRKGVFTEEEYDAIQKEVDAAVAVNKMFDPKLNALMKELEKKRRQIGEEG